MLLFSAQTFWILLAATCARPCVFQTHRRARALVHRPLLLTCSDGVETWAWSWNLSLTLDGSPTIGLRAYDWPHEVLFQTFPHQGVDHLSMDLALPRDSNKVCRLPADWRGGEVSASGAPLRITMTAVRFGA